MGPVAIEGSSHQRELEREAEQRKLLLTLRSARSPISMDEGLVTCYLLTPALRRHPTTNAQYAPTHRGHTYVGTSQW
jgi:hypothetical protein